MLNVYRPLLKLTLLTASLLSFSSFALSTTKTKAPPRFVQVASFLNKANADNYQHLLEKRLQQPVRVHQSKQWSKVEVGPLASIDEVKALQIQLNSIKQPLEKTALPPIVSKAAIESPPTKQLAKKAKGSKRVWNLHLANIRSVIAEVAKETHKNFVIDPRVQGKISIISGKPIASDELYQVFLSMLQVSGFAAVPSGEVIKIVPNIDARTLGTVDASYGSKGKNDEIIVQVVPVYHVASEQLVPVLRPLMPQWSNVSAYGPSNMLILSGRASNILRLAHIIRQVDSSSSKGIDIIQLYHSLAMDVVATIKSLTTNQRSGIRTQQATIAADDKSNTVLISGNKTDRLRLHLLISRLDKKGPSGNKGNTQVIYLHFLRAEDLVPILASVAKANFSGSVGTTIGSITTPPLDSTSPSNTANDQSADTGASTRATSSPSQLSPATKASSNQTDGDSKPTVQIIAEPNTNAIIISAPNTLIRTLKTVVRQLDVRPAQVLVEALIAEVDESDVNQLGIAWGSRQVDTNGASVFRPGFAILNSATRLSDFQAQLYALSNQQRANILSTPSVVVLDNHQAKILIGKQVSIEESTQPNNANGGNPFTTYNRQNVALHLYVRPQISQGKGLQLQIDQGNDTLADTADPTSGRPVINTSSILTSVLVNSGDVLVLGGLTQNGLQNTGTKQPILGGIPGLGQLFQNNRRRRDKKVLMVFIRPIILSTEETGLQVTGSKYNAIRKEQLSWLRETPFHKDNSQMVMPPLKRLTLPAPFSLNTKDKFSHQGK